MKKENGKRRGGQSEQLFFNLEEIRAEKRKLE
jgi:hypothetical protein